MTRSTWILLGISLCFALAAVGVGVQVLERSAPARVDISRKASTSLHPMTVHVLKQLEEPVYFTVVMTKRADMPSEYKRVEVGVLRVLDRIVGFAPDRISYEIVDPTDDAQLAVYASRLRASPKHVQRISGDRETETVVWSSIVISMGSERDTHVQGITEAHLPFLEQQIIGNLQAMWRPLQPFVVLVGAEERDSLRTMISQHATIEEFDIQSGEPLPHRVDLLIWIDPPPATPGQAAWIERSLADGKNIVLAGSRYDATVGEGPAETTRVSFEPKPTGLPDLVERFGVEVEEVLVFDDRCLTVQLPGMDGKRVPQRRPFIIRTLPANMNMRNFSQLATQALNFVPASSMRVDMAKAKAAGFTAQIAITTSDKVWTLPLEKVKIPVADMTAVTYSAKKPLAILLRPDDPFAGSLLVVGSTSIFDEHVAGSVGTGAQPFWRLLLRTFAGDPAIVKSRIDRRLPKTFKPLAAGSELFWRVVVMLGAALALLLIMWRRAGPIQLPTMNYRAILLGTVVTVAGFGIIGVTTARLGAQRADLTADRVNSLGGLTLKTVRELPQKATLDLRCAPASLLPQRIKRARRITRKLLNDTVASSGGRLKFIRTTVPPPEEGEDPEDLYRPGCELLVGGDGGSVNIAPLGLEQASQLEFLLVMALQELTTGRPKRIAVVSDRPRLSPAEAYEDYQKKQLAAPSGADVYADAKRLLRSHLFEVVDIDPRKGTLPDDIDLVIWMQPRRDRVAMGDSLGQYLYGGGNAIVASQHYNIQQRQYRGRSFKTVYWPQPQYVDMKDYYSLLGVEQVREVLMDEVQSDLELETQLNRIGHREHGGQKVARPFLIKAIPAGFASAPVTERLGDLLFVWGNRFVVDAEDAAAGISGLQFTHLISTSNRAWAYDWSGGFLQDDVFKTDSYMDRPQTLALDIQGRFPPIEIYTPAPPEGGGGLTSHRPELRRDESAAPASEDGRLLLLGSSEMFKNRHIIAEGFQHREFLVNLSTELTLGSEAVELLWKKPPVRGFETPEAAQVLQTRLLVLGAPAVAALMFGALWFAIRRSRRRLRHA